MPWKTTVEHAKEDLREGKSPTTAAGEFVKEEMEHIRRGKHGARSTKQAIAIGLSKARRAGVPLKPPKRGKVKESTRRSAEREYRKGQAGVGRTRPKYSKIREAVLKREPRQAASRQALSRQARQAAAKRGREGAVTPGAGRPRAAAQKAARTKGAAGRRAAARKAAQTRKLTASRRTSARSRRQPKKAA